MDSTIMNRLPVFAPLPAAEKRHIFELMTVIRRRRGQILSDQNDLSPMVVTVVEGRVKLVHQTEEGTESISAVLGPGELIGDLALFDNRARVESAIALTPTTALCLGRTEMLRLLEDYPRVCHTLAASFARRLRTSSELRSDLVFSDVRARMAKVLIDLSERFGEAAAVGILVSHGLTQDDMARIIGASRETVNKALSEFVSRGWISIEGRSVTILDGEKLSRRAR